MKKQIIVVGEIGNTEWQKRDGGRILSRGGVRVYPQSTYQHRQTDGGEEMDKKTRYIGNFLGFGASYDGAVWDRKATAPTIRAAASHGSAPYVICKVENEKRKTDKHSRKDNTYKQ